MPAPKDPEKYKLWIERLRESHKGIKQTEESNRKRSKSLKGRKMSKEFCENQSIRMKENNPMHNPKTVKKMIKTITGRKIGPHSKEHSRKIGEAQIGSKSHSWKGGCYITWHNKAYDLFGKDKCIKCGMSNKDHIDKWGQRLDMHNTLLPKDYTILKEDAWMTLCKRCHTKLEASIK